MFNTRSLALVVVTISTFASLGNKPAAAEPLRRISRISSHELGIGGLLVGNSAGRAIRVTRVNPSSVASDMGLEPRDYILKINGEVPESQDHLDWALQNPSGEVALKIKRGKLIGTLAGTLPVEDFAPVFTASRPIPQAQPLELGAEVGVYRDHQGQYVQVERIHQDGSGQRGGLRVGDIIVRVNGRNVVDLPEIQQEIAKSHMATMDVHQPGEDLRRIVIR